MTGGCNLILFFSFRFQKGKEGSAGVGDKVFSWALHRYALREYEIAQEGSLQMMIMMMMMMMMMMASDDDITTISCQILFFTT